MALFPINGTLVDPELIIAAKVGFSVSGGPLTGFSISPRLELLLRGGDWVYIHYESEEDAKETLGELSSA